MSIAFNFVNHHCPLPKSQPSLQLLVTTLAIELLPTLHPDLFSLSLPLHAKLEEKKAIEDQAMAEADRWNCT